MLVVIKYGIISNTGKYLFEIWLSFSHKYASTRRALFVLSRHQSFTLSSVTLLFNEGGDKDPLPLSFSLICRKVNIHWVVFQTWRLASPSESKAPNSIHSAPWNETRLVCLSRQLWWCFVHWGVDQLFKPRISSKHVPAAW